MATLETLVCISCDSVVRPRQELLQCRNCMGWQHRTCDSGVTRRRFRDFLRGTEEADWVCSTCKMETDTVIDTPTAMSEVASLVIPLTSPRMNSTAMDTSSAEYPEARIDLSAPNSPQLLGETFELFPDYDLDMQLSTTQPPTSPDTAAMRSPMLPTTSPLQPSDTSSFNLDMTFAIPSAIREDSIVDDSIGDIIEDHDALTFTVLDTASQRGSRKLVDNHGYTYTVKKKSDKKTFWWCSVRNKTMRCRATVQQEGDNFVVGQHRHCHGGQPGILTAMEITTQVKQKVTLPGNLFNSASSIIDDVLTEKVDLREPEDSRPTHSLLVRTANRVRQRLRPKDPLNLEFQLDMDFVPSDFFKADVHVDYDRHLVFATDAQLNLLAKAKQWYIDGTFKVVKDPFVQLLSVHGFVRSGDNMKQLPLVFVLMSRRRKKDYKQVLQAVVDLLPQAPRVESFVADFEKGLWQGLRLVFDNPTIQGCAFHWGQAVWRKVQDVGLKTAYSERDDVYKFVRKLLALPFLPKEHIQPTFVQLQATVSNPKVEELTDYVEDTWFSSTVWLVDNWCVFQTPVRTNNDVEGWHRRLNKRAADGKPPFYLLLLLLHKETELLPIQIKLVSEGKLKRFQRKRSRYTQGRLFSLWDAYVKGDISTTTLLKKCGRLYGPVASTE